MCSVATLNTVVGTTTISSPTQGLYKIFDCLSITSLKSRKIVASRTSHVILFKIIAGFSVRLRWLNNWVLALIHSQLPYRTTISIRTCHGIHVMRETKLNSDSCIPFGYRHCGSVWRYRMLLRQTVLSAKNASLYYGSIWPWYCRSAILSLSLITLAKHSRFFVA